MDEHTEWVGAALRDATRDIQPSPDLDARVAAILRGGGRPRRPARWAVPLLAACVVIVVAVGALVLVDTTGESRGGVSVITDGPQPVKPPSDPRWVEGTPSPWGNRRANTLVWTGREAIVWGGIPDTPTGPEPPTADGMAYDPATDTWRRLPPAPLAGRYNHVAVWTGKEMIVLGGAGGPGVATDGAAYDPASNAWRSIPNAPLARVGRSIIDQPVVWTGSEMLVWTTPGLGPDAGAAYNPVTNAWRSVPGIPGGTSSVGWTGQRVVAFGRPTPLFAGPQAVVTSVDGDAFDPKDGTWRALPPSGVAPPGGAVGWTDDELLVVTIPPRREGRPAARYRPAHGSWHDMAPIPVEDAWADVVFSVWTGDEFLMVGFPERGGGAMSALAYSRTEDRWRTVPAPEGITSSVQVVRGAGGALVWRSDRILRYVP
jgi:hypothetical protein